MSGEDVVGMVEAEVQKLIKSDPERYEIMPYPKGQKEGNIIKDENGKDVRIIKLDYLRYVFGAAGSSDKLARGIRGGDSG